MEAVHTVESVKLILEHIGINPKRLSLEWVSAAEAPRYVEIVTSFTQRITSLGPLGNREGLDKETILRKLKAAKICVQKEKFRWILGKRTEFAREGNKYGERFTHHELNRLMQGIILEELAVHQILDLINTEALTAKEIAKRLQLKPSLVLQHLSALRRRNMVAIKESPPRGVVYLTCSTDDGKRNGY